MKSICHNQTSNNVVVYITQVVSYCFNVDTGNNGTDVQPVNGMLIGGVIGGVVGALLLLCIIIAIVIACVKWCTCCPCVKLKHSEVGKRFTILLLVIILCYKPTTADINIVFELCDSGTASWDAHFERFM